MGGGEGRRGGREGRGEEGSSILCDRLFFVNRYQ